MDKGAHFYNCDFQVHSPRDLNWSGNRPADESGCREYAQSLIAACREKNLDAIAITDHHDLVFFPCIKKAAAEETDEGGSILSVDKQVVVFPGMELTLSVPCQALIIFDADFPIEFLPQIPTILGVSQPASPTERHSEIVRLEQYDTIEKLQDELSRHSFLVDKFIILPNVGKNGDTSILRKGFAAKYKNMPCVGGYVDGDISKLKEGNADIVAGKNKDYGYKRVAVIQTSDNRSVDHSALGQNTTWIKWAKPTAEALRQACLAQESRISQTEPQFPTYQICSLNVSNSRFMGPIALELNPQFNALIGGRGTGKSSILEYIRWALCDAPIGDQEDDGNYSLEQKRQQLIDNTLKAMEGEIRLGISLNGVAHTIRRNSVSGDLQLKVENGAFENVTSAQVRQLFPSQAYSQKQLSGVGVKQAELFRFLLSPVENELKKFDEALEQNSLSIKANYQQLQRQRLLERSINENESQIKSLGTQIQKLKENLSGISDEDRQIMDTNEKILAEHSLVQSYSHLIQQLSNDSSSIIKNIRRTSQSLKSPDENSPNVQMVTEIFNNYKKIVDSLSEAANSIERELAQNSSVRQAIQEKISEWKPRVDEQTRLYESAKLRYSSHENTLKEVTNLESQVKAKKDDLEKLVTELAILSDPLSEDNRQRNIRREILASRVQLMTKQCETLNTLSNGALRASLKISFDAAGAIEQLKAATTGSKIRSKQFENLLAQISEKENSEEVWQTVLNDLEALVISTLAKSETLPELPALTGLAFPSKDFPKLAETLSADNWLLLSLLKPNEEITFYYRVREEDYIPFSQASAGQQATVLLSVLLNQEGPPLVIDQPEDDLDNQVILDVVTKVWGAKRRRQIIFTSHNANLVVNGDAELVICCDYRTAGDHSGGTIQAIGAIDIPEVRSAITTIMEGGKEAFNLRRQKYGF